MKSYVLAFAFSRNKEQIALIKKNRPDWQKGKWTGIGGKIEPGESPYEAIYREFEEETGVKIYTPVRVGETANNAFEHFGTMKYKSGTVYLFRVFTNAIYQVESKTDEEVEVFTVDRLPKNTIHDLSYLVPLALDEKTNFTEIEYKD